MTKINLPQEELTIRNEYGKVLAELGASHPDLVVLDADLSGSTKTSTFCKTYPERFFNCGVAEQNMIGIAGGLAVSGKIVFASTFAMFATGRPWDMIRNTIAYPRLNVKIAATHGGLSVGPDGASHQALEDIALMRVIPQMQVFVPADGYEVRSIVRYAADNHGPTYIRMCRPGSKTVYTSEPEFTPGKATILAEGTDVSLIACGLMTRLALEAAQELLGQGISAQVVNMASIKPLDTDLLIKLAQTGRPLVTIEEHSIIGGLGSAVAETVCEVAPAIVKRLGTANVFGESGSQSELFEKHGLTVQRITQAAQEAVRQKG